VPREPFEYAVLRVSPRVERGELVNVGVVLFCRTKRFLGVRVALGERQVAALRALAAELDLEAVRAHLASIEAIVGGEAAAGPIAELDAPERFRWVTSPSSTVIQPSDVHGGLTDDPAASIAELFETLVQ
jgi:CO/xanthine dehydrogenase FAD-binding subunit